MRPKPFRLPKKVRITSKVTYQVREVAACSEENLVGECDFKGRLITVLRKLRPRDKEETFWHEVLHAMCFENGINVPVDLEETIIGIVERPFTKLMRANRFRP
jgi:hypothetical protein